MAGRLSARLEAELSQAIERTEGHIETFARSEKGDAVAEYAKLTDEIGMISQLSQEYQSALIEELYQKLTKARQNRTVTELGFGGGHDV